MNFKNSANEQLAGSYISRQLSNHLNLLATFYNTSRSVLIRNLIKEHLDSDKKIPEMIQGLAERVCQSWREYCSDRGPKAKTFSEFLVEIQEALEHKKLANAHIQLILIKAKEVYAKNNPTEDTE